MIIRNGGQISSRDIDYAVKNTDLKMQLNEIFLDKIEVSSKRTHIASRSEGQKRYIEEIGRAHV